MGFYWLFEGCNKRPDRMSWSAVNPTARRMVVSKFCVLLFWMLNLFVGYLPTSWWLVLMLPTLICLVFALFGVLSVNLDLIHRRKTEKAWEEVALAVLVTIGESMLMCRRWQLVASYGVMLGLQFLKKFTAKEPIAFTTAEIFFVRLCVVSLAMLSWISFTEWYFYRLPVHELGSRFLFVFGLLLAGAMLMGRPQATPKEDAEACGICMEPFSSRLDFVLTECLHKFHGSCLKSWGSRQRCCPYDRLPIRQALINQLNEREQ